MKLSDISIRRPVFATVINLLVIILGIVAFTDLPLREYPDIDPPIVTVETLYTGASAEIIESRVTQVLEDSISGIQGIRSIESKSEDGLSTISVEFTLKKDIEEAANDVRDRVTRVQGMLPSEVETPQISKVDSNTQAIFWIALQSKARDGLELTDYADRYLKDRLSVVEGVSRVQIGGERRYAMRLWLDRNALAARSLTAQDVEQALLRENIELPAGRIESLAREFTVRVDRVYNKLDDFKQLVVARGKDGHLVRLADVAKIEKGAADERTELRYNAKSSIGLGIVKQSNANTLDVIRGIKAEMAKIAPTLPKDIIMEVAFDSGIFIEGAVHEVYMTIFLTIALVIFVIWIFLGDLRATIIPSVAIPVSLIGSFIVLWAFGFSMNLLTLLALVLAIGLVVDDAIVVLENVYKRIEDGKPPLASSFIGVNQVAFAVVATTLVLVAVFLPVSLMPGSTGKLFTEFAWAMIGAILFSSFTALSLTPMLCSQILRKPEAGHRKNPITNYVNNLLAKWTLKYHTVLDGCFRRPSLIIGFMVLILAFGVFLFKFTPSEYAPKEDRGYFLSVMMAPEGASLEYSKRGMLELETKLTKLLAHDQGGPKDSTGEINGIVTIVPAGFSATGSVNGGFAFVLLKPWNERDRKVQEIVWGDFLAGTPGVFQDFMSIPGVMAFPIEPASLGQNGFSTPVQFVIAGPEYKELAKWRDQILEKARSSPLLSNLDYDYKETKPQLRIVINRDRAADLGVSVSEIGNTLQTFFGSRKVTNYMDAGKQYDVVLQGRDQDRSKPTDMTNVYVRSARTGQLIPLSNLVEIKESADAGALGRTNRMRSITISANVGAGYTLGEALTFLDQTAKDVLPPEAKVDFKGESRDFKESGYSIYLVFALALLAVYLFLAAQFENWIHPLVIMTTVPLAVVGALWGLFLTNSTLNIYTEIGLIMLVGLAAKNGILIVEFTNQLRDQGVEFIEAIKTAAEQRLRPIIMTSLSAVAGATPLLLASGAGSESRFPIGVVIFGGVIFSTFFTLFVVPTFYALLARHTASPEATGRRLEAELQSPESVSSAFRRES
ncbi:MAG: efflux RND transporter permease subunit [Alphaproteobacteria bacterium]|jgi:multidrug efflux pump|nr:efflux RND transporter permease subunit [Alphaproteobacteria bacterium]MBP9868136.1 efflux RND transporter permease subunit [Alphaproteobacteria bacterium]